ncbi:hypothetical protein R4Z09_10770 [Niallia oryzisoli]|uniref:Uncharacterized protein n=1 Tax=Niallia oryzisoli TaxID=1737571 RepID=A0ABZ2CI32_9BACI
MELEPDKLVTIIIGVINAIFSGLRWNEERKRNNPPSHKDQADRNVGS